MGAYRDVYENWKSDPEGFWMEAAKNIDWSVPPTKALDDSKPPFYRWFADAEMNTCYNCVDRHVEAGQGEKTAIIYDSPITETKAEISYAALQDQTARLAGVLRDLGVGKGDRVIIYMPMTPDAAVAMLACARIGAVHSVVFGGFAASELAVRIDDCQPKEAVASAAPADCVPVGGADPLYILYTSGTTGQPKGVVRAAGGHAVALHWTMGNIYDITKDDVFWAASDVGWVVGHSYIVYAPLLLGCTTVLFEGKPVGTPDAGTFWRVISEHNVKALFTAPTAFRAIKRVDPEGEFVGKYDLSCLETLFLAGERADPPTVEWARQQLKVPVIDHWWQTETGWTITGNPSGRAHRCPAMTFASLMKAETRLRTGRSARSV